MLHIALVLRHFSQRFFVYHFTIPLLVHRIIYSLANIYTGHVQLRQKLGLWACMVWRKGFSTFPRILVHFRSRCVVLAAVMAINKFIKAHNIHTNCQAKLGKELIIWIIQRYLHGMQGRGVQVETSRSKVKPIEVTVMHVPTMIHFRAIWTPCMYWNGCVVCRF